MLSILINFSSNTNEIQCLQNLSIWKRTTQYVSPIFSQVTRIFRKFIENPKLFSFCLCHTKEFKQHFPGLIWFYVFEINTWNPPLYTSHSELHHPFAQLFPSTFIRGNFPFAMFTNNLLSQYITRLCNNARSINSSIKFNQHPFAIQLLHSINKHKWSRPWSLPTVDSMKRFVFGDNCLNIISSVLIDHAVLINRSF